MCGGRERRSFLGGKSLRGLEKQDGWSPAGTDRKKPSILGRVPGAMETEGDATTSPLPLGAVVVLGPPWRGM